MKETKVKNLLMWAESQLELLSGDFTSATTEKVKYELSHRQGSAEEQAELDRLDSKADYFYEQIEVFNDLITQLTTWDAIKNKIEYKTIEGKESYTFKITSDDSEFEEIDELLQRVVSYE